MLEVTQRQHGVTMTWTSRFVDLLFWAALAAMLWAQFTKFWIFYEGNGERILHLAMAGIIFTFDYMRRNFGVPRLIEGFAYVGIFMGTFFYMWTVRVDIITRQGFGTNADIISLIFLVAVAIRLAKSVFGWVFPIIAITSVLYSLYSQHLPGVFHGPDLGWHRVGSRFATELHSSFMIFTTNFLWILIFWGLLLSISGVNISVLKAANYLARLLHAGPSMICLVASAAAGSFTGAGPTNTLITGPITIPTMVKAGYTPPEAAAVEALASHGSALTPPIMGTVAFIMAGMLGVSYINIIVMVLPSAALWYLGVLVYLYGHFRRNRHRIDSQIDISAYTNVSSWMTFKSALMGIIPLMTLLIMLVYDYTLKQTTWWVLLIFLFTAIVLRTETDTKIWIAGIRRAAVLASGVTLVLLTIVIFDRAITMTGLEHRIADIVYDLSKGSLLAATFFMIVGGVLLGAALPTIAVFFIMILTFVPVMIKFDIDRQVSFFIAFYVGTLSSITPPVASGVLVAAAVARTSYMATSKVVIFMGLPLFFFPFLYVFSPELMLQGDDTFRKSWIIGTIAVSLVALQAGAAGWMFRDLNWPERIALMTSPVIVFIGLYTHQTNSEAVGDIIVVAGGYIPLAVVGPQAFLTRSRDAETDRRRAAAQESQPAPGTVPDASPLATAEE